MIAGHDGNGSSTRIAGVPIMRGREGGSSLCGRSGEDCGGRKRDPHSLGAGRLRTGDSQRRHGRPGGDVPLVTSETAGHVYAVVNVNVFENVEQSRLSRAAADFEGEDVGSRLARRQRNWIADVRILEADVTIVNG